MTYIDLCERGDSLSTTTRRPIKGYLRPSHVFLLVNPLASFTLKHPSIVIFYLYI